MAPESQNSSLLRTKFNRTPLSGVVLDTLILGETRLPPLASFLIVAFFA